MTEAVKKCHQKSSELVRSRCRFFDTVLTVCIVGYAKVSRIPESGHPSILSCDWRVHTMAVRIKNAHKFTSPIEQTHISEQTCTLFLEPDSGFLGTLGHTS